MKEESHRKKLACLAGQGIIVKHLVSQNPLANAIEDFIVWKDHKIDNKMQPSQDITLPKDLLGS